MQRFRVMTLLLLVGIAGSASAQTPEPWATYRGNPQRTGNTDGIPLPEKPQVKWVLRSKEHFIASPVPHTDGLFVSSLGAFNVSSFQRLPWKPTGEPMPLWSKSTPFLKMPTVSSPAVMGDYLLFGDGMHQTSGATLYCLAAKSGRPIWQLHVPGELVHLEGSPTVVGNRAYIGGGSAGVLCIEADRAELDGKVLDLATIQTAQEKKWQELQAAFEIEKKKDPDFAVPPNEDQLLKPVPKILWQAGKEKWHVDAPINVVGGRVLAASAYLDKEQTGDRALHCLDAETGKPIWRVPLGINPWGGASVFEGTAVVAGSSIPYDTKALAAAKGEIVAVKIATGEVLWKKDIPKGGILGSVALAKGLAVVTASDGQIRAWSIETGDNRWRFDAKYPIFAPPTIVGEVVVVADLRGVIHGIGLQDGQSKWQIDLGKEAGVNAPGMVYGGAFAKEGCLLIATCNIEGPNAQKPTVVVCLGAK